MKARKASRCPLCHGKVAIGQQIGRTPIGWCHTGCIILAADGSLWDAAAQDPPPAVVTIAPAGPNSASVTTGRP
jgi:hypothetical protein